MNPSQITVLRGILRALQTQLVADPKSARDITDQCNEYLARAELPDELRAEFDTLKRRAERV